MVTRHVNIHGRVQGVFYRSWMVEAAKKHDVTGWVRNRSNGTVEAVISGPEESVASLIKSCYRGPVASRVDRIDVDECEPEQFTAFEQRPTL